MTLDKLTVTHYASLLAACWRALGTLEVEDPRITGVFGVEDYDHPSNHCGMLEATCTHSGQLVSLTGPRMLPLVHGYHRSGPNSDAAGGDPRPYLITGGSRASGLGMPDLSLIRLPAPALDARLARLLLSQPHAIIGLLAAGVVRVGGGTEWQYPVRHNRTSADCGAAGGDPRRALHRAGQPRTGSCLLYTSPSPRDA